MTEARKTEKKAEKALRYSPGQLVPNSAGGHVRRASPRGREILDDMEAMQLDEATEQARWEWMKNTPRFLARIEVHGLDPLPGFPEKDEATANAELSETIERHRGNLPVAGFALEPGAWRPDPTNPVLWEMTARSMTLISELSAAGYTLVQLYRKERDVHVLMFVLGLKLPEELRIQVPTSVDEVMVTGVWDQIKVLLTTRPSPTGKLYREDVVQLITPHRQEELHTTKTWYGLGPRRHAKGLVSYHAWGLQKLTPEQKREMERRAKRLLPRKRKEVRLVLEAVTHFNKPTLPGFPEKPWSEEGAKAARENAAKREGWDAGVFDPDNPMAGAHKEEGYLVRTGDLLRELKAEGYFFQSCHFQRVTKTRTRLDTATNTFVAVKDTEGNPVKVQKVRYTLVYRKEESTATEPESAMRLIKSLTWDRVSLFRNPILEADKQPTHFDVVMLCKQHPLPNLHPDGRLWVFPRGARANDHE